MHNVLSVRNVMSRYVTPRTSSPSSREFIRNRLVSRMRPQPRHCVVQEDAAPIPSRVRLSRADLACWRCELCRGERWASRRDRFTYGVQSPSRRRHAAVTWRATPRFAHINVKATLLNNLVEFLLFVYLCLYDASIYETADTSLIAIWITQHYV